MNNIKGVYPITWLGCPIVQQPNNVIIGDKVGWAKQPKQPYNLKNDISTINQNPTTLDVMELENFADQKDEFLVERQKLLENLKNKQEFLVWTGNNNDKWETYKIFKPEYCLRQILKDEVIIEFDTDDENRAWEGVNFTALNLYRAKYGFDIWFFKNGRSPHLHIWDLPIKQYSEEQRTLFKKFFIRKYVPQEYLPFVDIRLTEPRRLIALEFSQHWKSLLPQSHPKYKPTGIKLLLKRFTQND